MRAGPVIAGNWKMNLDPDEVREFFQNFRPNLPPGRAPQILVFPSFVSLFAALVALPRDPEIGVGVQNIHWKPSGAFTGEVSAPMARAAGATHTLVGHSERRHVFGETDEEVALKVSAAFSAGLIPVICVGEKLEERRAGRLEEVILGQLDAVLPVLSGAGSAGVLLAYEPVWAIGTGETATPDDASQAHSILRTRLLETLGGPRSEGIPILYGGSVKPANAAELLRAPHVGGVLVGGASLDPTSFSRIAEAGAGG
ncbi:MAG: triose-phosphate isomerase [Gemmatimonadota bacterium]